jgi:hypothetical protein
MNTRAGRALARRGMKRLKRIGPLACADALILTISYFATYSIRTGVFPSNLGGDGVSPFLLIACRDALLWGLPAHLVPR